MLHINMFACIIKFCIWLPVSTILLLCCITYKNGYWTRVKRQVGENTTQQVRPWQRAAVDSIFKLSSSPLPDSLLSTETTFNKWRFLNRENCNVRIDIVHVSCSFIETLYVVVTQIPGILMTEGLHVVSPQCSTSVYFVFPWCIAVHFSFAVGPVWVDATYDPPGVLWREYEYTWVIRIWHIIAVRRPTWHVYGVERGMYRLQHGLQLIMRVQRAIINCRPCCNLLISWPLTRWRLTRKHIIVQTSSSNPWN